METTRHEIMKNLVLSGVASTSVLFDYPMLEGHDENSVFVRKQVAHNFEDFFQLLDSLAKPFKEFKATTTLVRWKKEVEVLKTDIHDSAKTVKPVMDRANALAAEILSNSVTRTYVHRKEAAKVAAEKGAESVNVLSEFTYLLDASGKIAVLTDNVARAAQAEQAHSGALYSLNSREDMKAKYSNVPYYGINQKTGEEVQKNIFTAWLESPRRRDLSGVTFDPSTTDRVVQDQFNIWRGWLYEPVKSDADLPFWELVLEVLCDGNEEYFDFVRKFLAHMIQKPKERPLCAIGISGPQGAGKSVFVKVIGSLMHSAHYNPNVAMQAVAGNQQGRDLEGVLLAYLDEASWGGDKLSTGALKKAITGESDRINEKFVPAYSVPTYKRIIFSSNENYYYHADPDDRRLLPLEIDRDKKLKSDAFFQLIVNGNELREEVQQAVMATLLEEDITDWVPHKALKALNINTGGAMLERSMTNVQRWLYESIKNRAFELPSMTPNDDPELVKDGFISVNDLKRSYALACSYDSFDKNRQVNLSCHEATATLRKTFGHTAKNVAQSRQYRIDWDVMQNNFEQQFKWKNALNWKENDADSDR